MIRTMGFYAFISAVAEVREVRQVPAERKLLYTSLKGVAGVPIPKVVSVCCYKSFGIKFMLTNCIHDWVGLYPSTLTATNKPTQNDLVMYTVC